MRAHDLEGIVAKRLADPYEPRTRWLKIKNPDYTQQEGRGERFGRDEAFVAKLIIGLTYDSIPKGRRRVVRGTLASPGSPRTSRSSSVRRWRIAGPLSYSFRRCCCWRVRSAF
jgi:hypothetical protein